MTLRFVLASPGAAIPRPLDPDGAVCVAAVLAEAEKAYASQLATALRASGIRIHELLADEIESQLPAVHDDESERVAELRATAAQDCRERLVVALRATNKPVRMMLADQIEQGKWG